MANFNYNSNVLFNVDQLIDDYDQVMIGAQGFVYKEIGSLFSAGQISTDIGIKVTVAGFASAQQSVFRFGTAVFTVNDSLIQTTATGVIDGATAVLLYGGGNTILNQGLISGIDPAILIIDSLGSGNRIVNSGTVSSTADVAIQVYGASPTEIVNSGLILSPTTFYAIRFGGLTADDIVRNSGTVMGGIDLGGGNDRYLGLGGSVDGAVNGGDGNDLFRPGDAEETFVGGAGTDTLDFRRTSGVTVALDLTETATGVADGDSYSGFEVILGSRTGADVLIGDGGANRLSGFGGRDSLDGRGGHDSVEGGFGVDTLTGGSGNDSFVFQNRYGMGDVITDFSPTGAAGDDRFVITAAGFGGGLVAGNLPAPRFQSRADNVAQDADDRFIFRTADRTLWFDVDGTGAAAPVMVADLQANATMTAADILIV